MANAKSQAPEASISMWWNMLPLLDIVYVVVSYMAHFYENDRPLQMAWLVIGAALFIGTLISCVKQLRVILPYQRIFRCELTFLVCITFLPTLAFIIADVRGAIAFHNNLDATPANMAFFLFVSFVTGAVLLSLGNTLLILSRFGRAVKILGVVFYSITWLALAAISYLTYALEYSLHDPSTE